MRKDLDAGILGRIVYKPLLLSVDFPTNTYRQFVGMSFFDFYDHFYCMIIKEYFNAQ